LLFYFENTMKTKGFSLLEVLITLAIVTGVIFSIITTQTLSLRQTHAAYYRTLAFIAVANLLERFRADPSPPGITQEFKLAGQEIIHDLPSGHAQYQCPAMAHTCSATVDWQDHGVQQVTLSTLL
jgi:prepilin-type N-terminal cleavage/methylation domain-containing protein